MYYYHQKLSDSNKGIYVNLCSGDSLFSDNLGSSFLKVKKAVSLNYYYCNVELNVVRIQWRLVPI